MKRFTLGLVSGLLLGIMLMGTIVAANPQIRLVVNGKDVVSDVPPQIINGYTMVPARPLAEALGATVAWDGATSTVIITSQQQTNMPIKPTEQQQVVNQTDKQKLPIKEALESLAKDISQLGYDVQYVERDTGKHYGSEWSNYVQVGIKTDKIPAEGNYDLGISWPVLNQIVPLIKEYFPDSEVWMLYMFNQKNGRYSRSELSIPSLHVGGSGGGNGEPYWVFDGAAKNRWVKSQVITPANTSTTPPNDGIIVDKGGEKMLKINGVETWLTEWKDENGDLFIPGRPIVEFLYSKYSDKGICLDINGKLVVNGVIYSIKTGLSPMQSILYSLNSCRDAGLITYSWNASTSDLTLK